MKAITYLLLTSGLLFVFGCSEEDSQVQKPKPNIGYTIVNDEKFPDIKRSVEIMLDNKIDSSTLHSLAQWLKESEQRTFNNTWVGYWVKGMNMHDGYWATTHFTPDLKVVIQGATLQEEKMLRTVEIEIANAEFIGAWYSDDPIVPSRFSLFQANEKHIIHRLFKDSSSSNNFYRKSNHKQGTKYEKIGGENYGEFFLVNKNGNFEAWDQNGHIFSGAKLSFSPQAH